MDDEEAVAAVGNAAALKLAEMLRSRPMVMRGVLRLLQGGRRVLKQRLGSSCRAGRRLVDNYCWPDYLREQYAIDL